MRSEFHWERDTENFHVYVSDRREKEGHRVIYLPKDRVIAHTRPFDCILSKREYGIQCCERDNDYDGNCDIHSARGVLRQQGGFTSRMHFAYDPPLPAPPRFALLNELRELRAEMHREKREVYRRIERAEGRINILFKAVDKMLRKLGWVR